MKVRARLFGALSGACLALVILAPSRAAADSVPRPPQTARPGTHTAPPAPHPAPTPRPRPQGSGGVSSQLQAYAAEGTSLFLVPLLLTLLIEVPVVAIAGRGSAPAWKAGVLVNTLTNPVAVLALLALAPFAQRSPSPVPYIVLVACIEVAVVVVEWRIFRWVLDWSNRRAFTTSLIANGLSFGIGLAIAGRITPL